jgi:hypothetical protein
MRAWLLAAASGIVGLTGGCTTSAMAQDASLDASYGSVSLDSGFSEDPYEISLNAGGSIDASSLGGGCAGQIADAPDFELTYSAGDLPLYISVDSDADTTLVVNLPDGSWSCDDDSAESLNPGLMYSSPLDGVYDIWVGNFSGSDIPDATLQISELGFGGSDSGGFGDDVGVNPDGEPYYGSVSLVAGFSEDPHSIHVAAGGSNDAASLDSACLGNIGSRPDFNLDYDAGGFPLYISAASDSDLTLVVRQPNGDYICDDDGADEPLDPGITWTKPQSGTYNIWVGDYDGDETPDATLHISETGYHSTQLDDSSSGETIDWSQAPTYGDVTLNSGFAPDPHSVSVTPGGDIEARTVDDSCVGQVASAPDFDLTYTPGGYPLYIYVESDEDTTLVINTPSGDWICDDDSSAGVNPGVGFKAPEEGLYDIWVGTYGGGVSGSATLNISETTFPQD